MQSRGFVFLLAGCTGLAAFLVTFVLLRPEPPPLAPSAARPMATAPAAPPPTNPNGDPPAAVVTRTLETVAAGPFVVGNHVDLVLPGEVAGTEVLLRDRRIVGVESRDNIGPPWRVTIELEAPQAKLLDQVKNLKNIEIRPRASNPRPS